VSVQA